MDEQKPESKTRERILDAAEQIFAERGFDGASMRNITAHAKVNLSVVYYYFKSKEDLLLAVFQKYIRPQMDKQIAMLEEARKAAGTAPIALKQLLEAFILPRTAQVSESVHQLITMLFARRNALEKNIFSSLDALTQKPRQIFMEELAKTCPELSERELRFRVESLEALLAGWRLIVPFVREKHPQELSKQQGLEMFIALTIHIFTAPPALPLSKPI